MPKDSQTALKNVERDMFDNFVLPLVTKEKVSHDVMLLEYGFEKDWYFGLPVGGHLVMESEIGTKTISRQYTPISPLNQKGKLSFLIKEYPATDDFPKGGRLTQWLAQ